MGCESDLQTLANFLASQHGTLPDPLMAQKCLHKGERERPPSPSCLSSLEARFYNICNRRMNVHDLFNKERCLHIEVNVLCHDPPTNVSNVQYLALSHLDWIGIKFKPYTYLPFIAAEKQKRIWEIAYCIDCCNATNFEFSLCVWMLLYCFLVLFYGWGYTTFPFCRKMWLARAILRVFTPVSAAWL